MTKRVAFAEFLLTALVASGAEGGDATIHTDTAANDDLRICAFIDVPVVTFVLDRGASQSLPGMSVDFARLGLGDTGRPLNCPTGVERPSLLR